MIGLALSLYRLPFDVWWHTQWGYAFVGICSLMALFVVIKSIQARRQSVPDALIIVSAVGWVIFTLVWALMPLDAIQALTPLSYTLFGLMIHLIIAFGLRYRRLQGDVKYLSTQLIHTQEIERSRVARALHNGLGQRLLANRMSLQLAHSKQPRKDLHKAISDLTGTMDELHHVVRDLRPAVLETLGLARALTNHGQRLNDMSDVDVITHVALPQRLAPHVEEHLFRLSQEALQNALKHAQATRIELRCQATSKGLQLNILDNGNGFQPVLVESRSGLGLITMRERARLINAKWSLHSQPGRGTSITVRLARHDWCLADLSSPLDTVDSPVVATS